MRATRCVRGVCSMVAAIVALPAIGAVVFSPSAALAEPSTPVLDYGAGGYRYLEVQPGAGPPDFAASEFDDSGFSTGPGPFGNNPFGCPIEPVTNWSQNTDLLVRRAIAVPLGTTDVTVYVAIDNDVDLFWNGAPLGSFTSEGCATYDAITVSVPAALLVGGTNVLAARAHDRGVASFLDLRVTANLPPACDTVGLSPATLWPPNHTMRSLTSHGGVDPEGDELTLEITSVTQDEALDGIADGHTSPDAIAPAPGATDAVQLRAERSGAGDGRVYRVGVTAIDSGGATCTTTVLVAVPHDHRRDGHAVDTAGVTVDSFAPLAPASSDTSQAQHQVLETPPPADPRRAPGPPDPAPPAASTRETASPATPPPGRLSDPPAIEPPPPPDPATREATEPSRNTGDGAHGKAPERAGPPQDRPTPVPRHP
jgi:hypothetical protein